MSLGLILVIILIIFLLGGFSGRFVSPGGTATQGQCGAVGRPEGIFVAPYEQGEIGPDLFDAACRMNLEGLVSKHRLRRYWPKTCDWIKVKNRQHPAFSRVMDQF